MDKLISKINELRASPIRSVVDNRIREFSELGAQNNHEIFKELCFCLLTANYSAEGGIKIQKEIGDGFFVLDEAELALKLKKLGHRFPNARANYIFGVRNLAENIKDKMQEFDND